MAKYEVPTFTEDATLEDLATLRAEAVAAAKAIDVTDESLSAEDLETAEAILGFIASVDERAGVLEGEATAANERRENLAAAMAGLDAPAEEEAVVEEPAEEAVVEEQEPVLASGQKRSTAAIAKRKAPAVLLNRSKEDESTPFQTIVAAANVPDFTVNQVLPDMTAVAQAFMSQVAGGPANPQDMKAARHTLNPGFQRQGVARIKRKDREFVVSKDQGNEGNFTTIMEAAREARLSQGSVLAAGGWCAPSEIDYGFCELETTEGLVDVPEVTARRGGISFTKGPDFMTLFADTDFGFIQTETQAEAGTEKPCYAVECPPFSEVRMDAIGFCITAGLLTNAGYPELVRRVLNLAGVGHARRKSQSTIQRISTALGTAINWAEIGGAGANSGTADVLDAVELQALRIRQSLAMSPTATIEGIAPFWLRPALRAELGRRLGLTDPFRISDSDVDGYFALRGIRLQYVYDYQMLTTTNTATWTKYPDTVEIMLYPAGAFVRLAHDVINLDAVYDHDLLTQNTYTAAFFEEGIAIANTCGFGVKVAIGLNYEGAAGYPQIGAPVPTP